MERDNQNKISMLLMAVGVLFIVIAGSIFVMTAWQYLPEFMKQVVLCAVSAGLFMGAHAASQKESLPKTETALFYLGTAFLGFFILSILGGIRGGSAELRMDALRAFVADVGMEAAVICRVYKTRSGFDFSISAVLMDGILVCSSLAFHAKYEVFILMLAVYLIALSFGDRRVRMRQEENTGFGIGMFVVYLLHGVLYSLLLFTVWFTDAFPGYRTLAVLVLVFITGMSRQESGHDILRLFNSLCIFGLTLVAVAETNMLFHWTERWGSLLLLAYGINLAVMVCMQRKEMFYIQFGFSLLAALFTACIQSVKRGAPVSEWISYHPYSFLTALALVFYMVRPGERDERREGLLKLAGLQMINGILLYVTWKWDILHSLTFFGVLTAIIWMGVVWIKDSQGKKILQTAALATIEMGMIVQCTGSGYGVEIACFFVGIGIVLFGCIWYDRDAVVRMVQFVLTCLILAVLLLNAMANRDMFHVFAVGMTGVIMLITAAIRESRRYVTAAAVTLALMAFYLTWRVWLSIAWWVYLFAAGVALIVLAARKEGKDS